MQGREYSAQKENSDEGDREKLQSGIDDESRRTRSTEDQAEQKEDRRSVPANRRCRRAGPKWRCQGLTGGWLPPPAAAATPRPIAASAPSAIRSVAVCEPLESVPDTSL